MKYKQKHPHTLREPNERSHVMRLWRVRSGNPRMMEFQHPQWQGNGSGEAEVVFGQQLSVILKRWVVQYLAENETKTGFRMKTEAMGPMQWLNLKTHSEQYPKGINLRRISGIVNGEFTWVSLSQADLLIKAIEMTHVFHDGQLQIIPNPNWSQEKWIEYQKEKRGCD